MKTILCILLLAGCTTLKPGIVGRADIGMGGSITLLDTPCDGKVAGILASKVRAQFREGWKSARGVFYMLNTRELKSFAGCWRDVPEDLTRGVPTVFLVFEDEDTMAIAKSQFDGRPHAAKPDTVSI